MSYQGAAMLWEPLRPQSGCGGEVRIRKRNIRSPSCPAPVHPWSTAAFLQLRRPLLTSGTVVEWVSVKLRQTCCDMGDCAGLS